MTDAGEALLERVARQVHTGGCGDYTHKALTVLAAICDELGITEEMVHSINLCSGSCDKGIARALRTLLEASTDDST